MRPYRDRDRTALQDLLHRIGWEPRYVAGQIGALDTFNREPERGLAIVVQWTDEPVAYISVEFHAWNRLGQIQGLVVDERYRREGVAGVTCLKLFE